MSTRGCDLPTIVYSVGAFSFTGCLGSSLISNFLAPISSPVAYFLPATGNDAVSDCELVCAELLGCFRKKRMTSGGRGLAQLHAANLNGQAAPGRALIWCEQRVALN